MKQVESLASNKVSEAYVDMGYRGHDYKGKATVHVDKRRRGRTPRPLWRWMKRRAAVEPSIGHLKLEHRLERNRLKGVAGDAINAVLAAAAMNFHKLLGAFWRSFLFALLEIWGQIRRTRVPFGPQMQCERTQKTFSGST
jgi:IS5 family transposase